MELRIINWTSNVPQVLKVVYLFKLPVFKIITFNVFYFSVND